MAILFISADNPFFRERRRSRGQSGASLVLLALSDLKEIILPKNKSGTPKHPMSWQRQKLKPQISIILQKNI